MNVFDFDNILGDGLDQESMLKFKHSNLGPELEKEINLLRTRSTVRKKDVENSELAKIVFDHTGIRNKVKAMAGEYNAYAMFPTLSADHVFYDTYDNKQMVKDYFRVKSPEEAVVGWVDVKAGRIGGYFSEIMHEQGIGLEFFNNSQFDTKEIVAIMLHEIGHLFYYYHKLSFMRSANYYMDHLAKELDEIKDPEKRIAYATKKQLKKGDVKSLKEISQAKDKSQITIILHNDILEEAGSDLGINNYDTRGWEYLADRYANSMGYGDYVVSGLDRMYQIYGIRNTSKWVNAIIQTFVLIILTVYTAGVVPLLLLTLVDHQRPVYDDPKKRFEVIRKDMIGQLRLLPIDDKEKPKIIRRIQNIDEVLNRMEPDTMDVFQFLQSHFGPRGRKVYRHTTVQKTLEHFANSELRLRAERLRNS
ncbi:hypothetical protein SM033_00236 [Vibrio phage vB_VpaM_sm033]|nr:hypothetical protein SM033_00236 [Vibrio phage vB_VpaM_sm033]